MIRKIAISAVSALAVMSGAVAAEEEHQVPNVDFSFEGPFGTFDEHQLQRGLQVYTEVCSACHGLKFVAIRDLAEDGGPHLPEDQVKAYAAAFSINDESSNPQFYDKEKEAFRTLVPSDHFPLNNSIGAPDLSVMAKARKGFSGPMGLGTNQLFKGMGGPEYITAILTGYSGETKDVGDSTFYQNETYPGGYIRMPPPLSDDVVTYADGTPANVAQMAQDVSAFLMWAAEPRMMARKSAGFKAVFLMGLFAVALYLTNKKLWSGIKGPKIKH